MDSETDSADVAAAKPLVNNKKRIMTGSSDDEDVSPRRKKRRNDVNTDLLDSDDSSNNSLGNSRSDSQENTSRTMPSLPKLTSKVTGKARTPKESKAESIPKKKTATIPKKKDLQGTPVKSSLLTQMAAPPKAPPVAPAKTPPPRDTPRRPVRPKPEPKVEIIKPPELSKEQKLQNFLANQQQQQMRVAPPRSTHLETVVMKDLKDLCGNVRLELPDAPLNMSGSFLEQSADYFDTNKKGEIVITPRPPMFPEEFQAKETHELSWWGILDPGITDQKAVRNGKGRSRNDHREERRWEDERRRREEERRREEGRRREDDRWRGGDRRRYDGPPPDFRGPPPPDFRGPPPPPNYGRYRGRR